jgi:nucleoid-associated protein YgaU
VDRRRARSHLLGLLGFEVAAVVLLHRLGNVRGLSVPFRSLAEWVHQAPPEEVLAAVLRLVALVVAWWLLGTTVLYSVSRAARVPAIVRAVGCATLPAVRRWSDRAFTATVVAGAALAVRPAAAAPPPPTGPAPAPPAVVLEVDHRDPPHSDARPASAPPVRTGRAGGLERAPAAAPAEPQMVETDPAPSPPAPAIPALPQTLPSPHVVQPGDSLWSIARTGLSLATGRAPEELTEGEIAAYWVAVVDVNRTRFGSGDPNLIFPGEVLELPPAV